MDADASPSFTHIGGSRRVIVAVICGYRQIDPAGALRRSECPPRQLLNGSLPVRMQLSSRHRCRFTLPIRQLAPSQAQWLGGELNPQLSKVHRSMGLLCSDGGERAGAWRPFAPVPEVRCRRRKAIGMQGGRWDDCPSGLRHLPGCYNTGVASMKAVASAVAMT